MQQAWQAFSARMAYTGALHAVIEPLPAALDPLALSALAERNQHVLNAVGSLEERRKESADDESPIMQELLRLDSKLNVLMEIVNRLLIPAAPLPPRQTLRFNAIGAELAGAALDEGRPGLLRLHFDVCLALPLELFGRGVATPRAGVSGILFEALGDPVCGGLERLVFRHHRRKVAQSKQSVS